MLRDMQARSGNTPPSPNGTAGSDNSSSFTPPSELSSTANANRTATEQQMLRDMQARSGSTPPSPNGTAGSDNSRSFTPPSELSSTANANRTATEQQMLRDMQARSGNTPPSPNGTAGSDNSSSFTPPSELSSTANANRTATEQQMLRDMQARSGNASSADDGDGGTGGLCLTAVCMGPSRTSPEGLAAKPFVNISGQFGFGQTKVDTGWNVYIGNQEIAGGFAERQATGWRNLCSNRRERIFERERERWGLQDF